MMTVKELLKKLKKFDKNAEVTIEGLTSSGFNHREGSKTVSLSLHKEKGEKPYVVLRHL